LITGDKLPAHIASVPTHEAYVRSACCAVAEIFLDEEISNRAAAEADKEIASESNDGFSVTYIKTPTQFDSRGADMQQALAARKYSEAVRYLYRTGLLFRGLL